MAVSIKFNQQIRSPELRVVDETGANLGVFSREEALRLATERSLDLIEISPMAKPPVAKIMDFGKYQYLENKKQKASRARTQVTETKNIQVKIGTGDHDLEIKANKVSAFLKEGHRVRVELFLRGRAKYFDQKFLTERLERLLKFVTEEYKIAEAPKKSHKGLTAVIEKLKQ